MLATGTGRGYAQVGWLEGAYGSRSTFVQVYDPYALTQTWYRPAQPELSAPLYSVRYNEVPKQFTFYVSGTRFYSSTFSVYAISILGSLKLLAETQNFNSQTPGDYGNFYEAYALSKIRDANGWHDFATYATGVHQASFFGHTISAPTLMYGWDNACWS
jgi:hypothetical protein